MKFNLLDRAKRGLPTMKRGDVISIAGAFDRSSFMLIRLNVSSYAFMGLSSASVYQDTVSMTPDDAVACLFHMLKNSDKLNLSDYIVVSSKHLELCEVAVSVD